MIDIVDPQQELEVSVWVKHGRQRHRWISLEYMDSDMRIRLCAKRFHASLPVVGRAGWTTWNLAGQV